MLHAFAGVSSCLFASRNNRLLVSRLDQAQVQSLRRPYLVELHTEFEAAFCPRYFRKSCLDVGQQCFPVLTRVPGNRISDPHAHARAERHG